MTAQVGMEPGEKGQKNALGVVNIILMGLLVVILAGVGIVAGVPAMPLGTVVGLIVAATAIFGKLP